jgi:phospholipid/cholesterol/gamma-HCH transport system ATP-binding protein
MAPNTDNNILFELRGVSKRFGKVEALRDVDFQIERGKTTVVIGPSGCGKTVLLKHLIVLIRPDQGQVLFDSVRVDDETEPRLVAMRRRCGFLFQAGALFDSETAAQNVAFPLIQHTDYQPTKIEKLALEKLEMVGLRDFAQRLPSELSGGQRKRVALARAIALSPEVILYDEPTTGLDPIRAETINDLITKLQNELKITSIVVTHDMHSANKVGDRIVMLSRGRIVADGTPEEIQNSPNEEVQRFLQGRSEGPDE